MYENCDLWRKKSNFAGKIEKKDKIANNYGFFKQYIR